MKKSLFDIITNKINGNMIYIQDEKQTEMLIMCHYDIPIAKKYSIELTNKINKTKTVIDLVDFQVFDEYYKFSNVDFSGLITGEYRYSLIADNETIETGLFVFGNYDNDNKSYQTNKKTIQYNG